ncbi:MAG: carbohydrate ABC transporter permease [Micropruina sp.]|nr:carbohydrate ABC transporter permease [Micropruina sp.]
MIDKRPAWVSALMYVIVSLALVAVISPFVWMVLGSLKTDGELRRVPPTWWPETATLDNYTQLFARLNFAQYFTNSLIVAVAVTIGNLLFCAMLGYALAMLNFRFKNAILTLVLGTLMIPGVVTFIPLYVLIVNLGMADTLPALIVPFLVAPFGVFLMRQFIQGLPPDLLDAGRVDGAGELTIFARIILPLLGPPMATLGILTFLGSWNNFLWPLVVAQNESTYTLPVALALYTTGQNQANYGLMLAGACVVVAPLLIVFLVFQRRFVAGIATTGIK